MTSIIGTPTLVDNGAYNGAYTAETGAEGVIILMAHEQTGTGRYMQSGTLGGQSLTNILQLQQQADGSSTWIVIEAWCLKSAGIAAMSGNAISMTAHASGNGNWKGVAYSLNAWDEVTTIVLSDTDGQFTATDLSLSVTPASGTIAVGIWACTDGAFGTASGKALTDAGFTHDRVPTNTGTGYAIHTGYRVGIGSLTGAGSAVNATLDSGTSSSTNAQAAAILVFPTAASGPTISSLGDTTPNYLGSTTIAGTGFPLSQTGSAAAALGGVAQSVTWNTDISCSIASIARGNLAYGNYNLVVTDAAGNASANYATSLSPQAGWKHITTSGTLAAAGSRITTTPTDVVSGNQIAVGNVVGGTINDVTLYVDGSYSCAPGVVSFQYEVHDGSVWGALGTEYPNSSGTGNLLSLARPLAIPLATNLNGG